MSFSESRPRGLAYLCRIPKGKTLRDKTTIKTKKIMGTVKFSVVGKRNPSNADAPLKYYACAQSAGVQSLEDMSKVIEKNCTLTSTDIMAVLHAMDEVMREQLANGQIARIGDLGYVRLSLHSTGAETAEAFNSSYIAYARIVFTPGINTRKALKTLNYVQVPKLPVKEKANDKA